MNRYYLRQKEDGNSLAVFSTVKRVGDEEYMPVNEAQAEIDEYKLIAMMMHDKWLAGHDFDINLSAELKTLMNKGE
jgi:hypothetical protein